MNPSDWQALLFVPANSEKLLQSAIKHKPDAVILDLEDGVATDKKAEARELLARQQAALAKAKIDCVLRINSDAALARLDIASAELNALAAIMVPKCTGRIALDRVTSFMGARAVPLIALVESPAALPQLTAIAATSGVCALMFGPEDYAAEFGLPSDEAELDIAAALLAAAAVAAKRLAIGIPGSLANFTDIKGFTEKVKRARRLGFRAAAAIHPAQLPAIRAGFKPSAAEIERAKKIVSASGKSTGAIKVDGAMVDAPIIEQAKRVLRLAGTS